MRRRAPAGQSVTLLKLPGIERGRPQKRMPAATEHEEQAALIRIARLWQGRVPELRNFAAVPNGGHRAIATARRMKAEGASPGIPDLQLLVPRDGVHGLFVEMKRIGGRCSPAQLEWHERLRAEGYRVEVCYTWLDAWRVIAAYLHRPELLEGL